MVNPVRRVRKARGRVLPSKSSGSAAPDPCSASMQSPFHGSHATGIARRRVLDGLRRASLDCPRSPGSSVSMVFAAAGRPCGPTSGSKGHGCTRRIGTAQSPRSGRSAAEQPRSGGRMLRIRLDLTATGRCGRRPAPAGHLAAMWRPTARLRRGPSSGRLRRPPSPARGEGEAPRPAALPKAPNRRTIRLGSVAIPGENGGRIGGVCGEARRGGRRSMSDAQNSGLGDVLSSAAGDSFTETTSKSWLQRILNSFVGALVGLVLVIASIVGHLLERGPRDRNGARARRGRRSGGQRRRRASRSGQRRQARACHGSGRRDGAARRPAIPGQGDRAETAARSRDVSVAPGRAQRDAQQARRRHGDGDDLRLHPRMEATAATIPAPSASPDGHANPPMAFARRDFVAADAKLGAFSLPPGLIGKLGDGARYDVDPAGLAGQAAQTPPEQVVDGAIYIGANPADPRVGDLKVSYFLVPKRPGQRHRPPDRHRPQPVSDQGRQSALHHRCRRTRRGADVQAGRARERDPDLGRPRRRARRDVDRLRARPFSAFGARQRHPLPGRARGRRRRADFVRPDPRDRAADGRDRVVRGAPADVDRHRGGGPASRRFSSRA